MKQKDIFCTNHLLRGQSLMYQACREGKLGCIKILREYGFAFTKANCTYAKKLESCLDVTIRLNYPTILNLILDSREYNVEEIERSLTTNEKYATRSCRLIVYNYLSKLKCKYRLKIAFNS